MNIRITRLAAFTVAAAVSCGGVSDPPHSPPPPDSRTWPAPPRISLPPAPVQPTAPPQPADDEPDPLIGVTPVTLGPAEVRILVEALPLQTNDIDFGRIRRFFDLYVAILAAEPPDRRGGAVIAIRQARVYMRQATDLTASQMINFKADGMNGEDLIAWAKPPRAASAYVLANMLEAVLRSTQQILADLCNYADSDRAETLFHQEDRQSIEQQVGGTHIPSGSSIVADNLRNITNARSYLPQPSAP